MPHRADQLWPDEAPKGEAPEIGGAQQTDQRGGISFLPRPDGQQGLEQPVPGKEQGGTDQDRHDRHQRRRVLWLRHQRCLSVMAHARQGAMHLRISGEARAAEPSVRNPG